ncbi:MAG: hypothetical protein K2N50_01585 [Clostridia bacterium]|nr:hypothetical protein [Clostridia bacterium]
MAEARLIDTDKDKKYRIKVNADGEEELVVEGVEEGHTEIEEVMFAVPDEVETVPDDGRGLTPEQLAEKREREEAEAAERRARVGELLEKAKSDISLYRFATALEFIEKAEEIDGENGEAQALKLEAYTRKFTDYSQIVPASDCAEKLKEFASAERKEQLFKVAAPSLEEEIAKLRATVSAMNKENEDKKAERAVRFNRDRNIAIGAFCALFAVLATFVALSGSFATLIRTVPTNYYLVLTLVFAGLALAALLAVAFAARFLNITCRRVRLNKRNTTTKLGRDLLAEQAKLKAFIAVYSALKGEK